MSRDPGSAGQRGAWRRPPLLAGGLALTLVLTLVFALRLGFAAGYWSASPRDPAIEPWMPVGYVARGWDVPREVLAEAIGVQPGSQPRRSIGAIAEAQGVSAAVLIERLQAAIEAYRQEGGP